MKISDKNPQEWLSEYMRDCVLCPRLCHADRMSGKTGYCGQTNIVTAARAALHFWEEPCISGVSGSGTVFFSGCGMRCVFCQNYNIAVGNIGRAVSLERLSAIFLELQAKGANNINLVTASHFIPQIALALKQAKTAGLVIPVVYNSSGYESVSSLQLLDGLIDIYLPDIKYFSEELSSRYSKAPDYFSVASLALSEMYRQVQKPQFEKTDSADPSVRLMTKGVIVRHMLLPGETKDSKKILRFLHETYHDDIYISIMNQYTPMPQVSMIPELSRKVSQEDYRKILKFAERIGIENGFFQYGETAAESFIPLFDYEGL